jgi:hypothetical protein
MKTKTTKNKRPSRNGKVHLHLSADEKALVKGNSKIGPRQYHILKLFHGGREVSFTDLRDHFGYRDNWTNLLCKGRKGSLGTLGLIRQVGWRNGGGVYANKPRGSRTLVHQITAKGEKLLKELKTVH